MTLMLPDYHLAETALQQVDGVLCAGELHGLLCGELIGAKGLSFAPWIERSLQWERPRALPLDAEQTLTQLFVVSRRQLMADDFSFQVLLPDDESDLVTRLEALSHWCQGFLAGFGLTGLQIDPTQERECYEALVDLNDIAQVSFELDKSEEDEAAFAELVEYVRMVVLLLHTNYGLGPAPSMTTH